MNVVVGVVIVVVGVVVIVVVGVVTVVVGVVGVVVTVVVGTTISATNTNNTFIEVFVSHLFKTFLQAHPLPHFGEYFVNPHLLLIDGDLQQR